MADLVDRLVSAHGQTVTLRRTTAAAYDADWDAYDEDNATEAEEQVVAIVSRPSETSVVEAHGREARVDATITVPSGTDIEADREGHPDEVDIDGRTYRVVRVRDTTHPFIGERKVTADLEALEGR